MSLPTTLLPDLHSSQELLCTLLDVSLTGVILFRPVYSSDGTCITDLAYVHLNPAAQRMLQLPDCPEATFLTLYPNAHDTGIFAFYRETFLSGEAGRYDINYSYDGLDNYFHLAARRSGEVLVVSFSDTADQPRTAVEQALRESQGRERTAREKAEAQQRELQRLFEQAPVAIGIYRGPDLVVEVANPPILELWGKTREESLGKPLFEVLPELKGQGYEALFAGVLETGIPVMGHEQPATLLRHGRLETAYFNFNYQALWDEQGIITGVINIAAEVTPLVLARQQAEQSRRQVQNLNEELAAANEELLANNEEVQAANEELVLTRQQLEQLNARLEAQVTSRTAELLAAQGEAERQRKQLHTLFEQAPVAVVVFRGPRLVIELANPAVCQFWGRTHAEVINKPLLEALPEVAGQGFDQLLGEVLTTGNPLEAEEVSAVLWRGGQLETVYFNHFYQPLYEPDGTISGVVVFAHEITGQVESRRKVEQSEGQVRAVIESAPFPIGVYVGREMRIAFINKANLDALGKSKEVIGRFYGEMLSDSNKKQVLAQLDEVFTTGIPVHATNVRAEIVIGQKKQEFYYNYSLIPLLDPSGKIYGVMNTAVDVTEINQARKKAEESEERFRIMANAAPNIVWALNPNGSLRYMNKYALDFLGVSLQEVIARNWTPFIHPEDLQAAGQIISEAIRNRKAYRQEVRMLRYDGQYCWFLSIGAPSYYSDGELYGYVGSAIDISELITANNQLKRTNQDLDNFIYTASHDLKAPIANIEGLLTTLLRTLPAECQTPVQVKRITSLMQESVERFKRTIASLTEVVKLQKENNQEATEVNLAKIVEEVLLDLAPVIQSSSARVEVDTADCTTVHFSAKNLRSVVYNLLSNGLKYRSPERVPHLRLQCKNTAGFHVLTVEDNGLGMEPGRMSQLFTMFKRFHDHVEGSGIGLYMVKKMVENAGGRIEAESQRGVGSTFRVFVPIKGSV
jgi:PAS domain S-box-containing protein